MVSRSGPRSGARSGARQEVPLQCKKKRQISANKGRWEGLASDGSLAIQESQESEETMRSETKEEVGTLKGERKRWGRDVMDGGENTGMGGR